VPWIKLPPTDWFNSGSESNGGFGRREPADKAKFGIQVGDKRLELSKKDVESLISSIYACKVDGAPSVNFSSRGEEVALPATDETLAALQKLLASGADPPKKAEEGTPKKDKPESLIISANEAELEIEGEFVAKRNGPPIQSPLKLATPLMTHQTEGLNWLQAAWTHGLPGVLLADDMGLGKTLQGLAFLAWLHEGMNSGSVARAPVLIVAPTGLLKNWRTEHDKHLLSPGLGDCVEAFGRGLARLKQNAGNGRPALDHTILAKADWVLTSYETIRDFDRDFGQVRFAAGLFDEAQNIKTPGVRITDAAKGMNCDFRIALTGTPVENRLADLWCITDGIQPGLLGDLKSFSAKYERDLDPDRLKRLKSTLERQLGARPPTMLRRLKRDRLQDLPEPTERALPTPMPPIQQRKYDDIIAKSTSATEPGAVLSTLQSLRSISLHPTPDEQLTDERFVSDSARLIATFGLLDEIATKGEKVLIFLDDISMQARLAGVLQRRFRLSSPPALINGSVDGPSRQARVDGFQGSADGFGAMILSPRAGDVGLTLTRANHVVHLSRWWNPAVEDQCTGRALRIGQTRPVFVHIPLAVVTGRAKSFDENLSALLDRKRKLMHETLMPAEATADADRDELFRSTIGR
jgi:SNF2 family DNA or RNA helicase